jgi:hypothetical protein
MLGPLGSGGPKGPLSPFTGKSASGAHIISQNYNNKQQIDAEIFNKWFKYLAFPKGFALVKKHVHVLRSSEVKELYTFIYTQITNICNKI